MDSKRFPQLAVEGVGDGIRLDQALLIVNLHFDMAKGIGLPHNALLQGWQDPQENLCNKLW